MKKKIIVLFSIILLVLSISNVRAFPPSDHTLMIDDLYNDPRFSTISPTFYNVMVGNKAYVQAGMHMTDMVIPTYWESYVTGGAKYGATHNFAFEQCLWTSAVNDQQRAVAMGNSLHIIQDSVIHNDKIPSVIRTYGIPNIPMHPIYELGEETVLRRDTPYLGTELETSLQPILSDPSMIAFIDNCMSKQTGVGRYDTKSALEFLNGIFGDPNGWGKALNLPSFYASFAYGNLMWGIIAFAIVVGLVFLEWKVVEKTWIRTLVAPFIIIFGIGAFLFTFGGIAAFSDTSAFPGLRTTAETKVICYLRTQCDQTQQCGSLQCWDKRWNVDATGFSNLHAADNTILTFWYVMIGLFVVALIVIILKIFDKI